MKSIFKAVILLSLLLGLVTGCSAKNDSNKKNSLEGRIKVTTESGNTRAPTSEVQTNAVSQSSSSLSYSTKEGSSTAVTNNSLKSAEVFCSSPYIKYIGRWDKTNSKAYVGYWGGTYFKAKFTGTTLKIFLNGVTDLTVSIDNKAEVFFDKVEGLVDLTPTPLAKGVHTVRVSSQFITYPINFEKLILDAGAVLKDVDTSKNLIEFIGDSITNACFISPRNTQFSFAWLTGEKLKSEHTQIAHAGMSLVNGYGYNAVKTGMETQYFKLTPLGQTNNSSYSFNQYKPNIIVINLGTNDQTSNVQAKTFENSYETFLGSIRNKYKNAQIIVLRPFGGYFAAEAQNVVNNVIQKGDKKVRYIDTTGWITGAEKYTGVPTGDTSDGIHPTPLGHAKIAEKLSTILLEYLIK